MLHSEPTVAIDRLLTLPIFTAYSDLILSRKSDSLGDQLTGFPSILE